MDTSTLSDLGLSHSEIKVYLSLNQLGTAKAGNIIKKSGLQSPVVHRAFHSLAEKGLITSVRMGKIREYQAVNPDSLVNIIDQRKEKVLKLIPELRAEQRGHDRLPKSRTYQSKKGVRELLYSLLQENPAKLLAYGGPSKSLEILGEYFWDGFHKRRIRSRISSQFILHNSLKIRAKKVNKMPFTQVRITNKDFEELVETFVSRNKIAIILYSEIPFGFLIEDKSVAKSYQEFFKLIWKSSKSI